MADEAAGKKSSTKFRVIAGIGAVLLIEAVLIVGVMMFIGRPGEVRADAEMADSGATADERIQEILVVDRKLPNNKSGVTYLYDTEIYVQVRARHADRVTAELEQFRNEITAEINSIWRTSHPSHFLEPNHENLNRKVEALLQRRFGNDSQSGEPIVVRTIIVMGTGFRIDS